MIIKNLFLRDEGDLLVTDETTEVVEESQDESPEDTQEITEGENEETPDDSDNVTDDSEDTKDESDDDYIDDEETYLRQYDYLPSDIKTTHDALEYMAEKMGDMPYADKYKQVDAQLKSMGYQNGIEDLLRQQSAGQQPANNQQGGYVSATETLNRKIASGELTEGEVALLQPLAQQQDQVTAMLGQGLQMLYNELNSLKQGNESIASRQSEVDYRNFVRTIKKDKIRPLAKADLDKIMKETPGLNSYHQAQMYLLVRDPEKMKHHLGMIRKNFEKGARKRLRDENKRFLQAKKKTSDYAGKTYDDYFQPGGEGDMSPAFWKLSDEEQNRIINSRLKRG